MTIKRCLLALAALLGLSLSTAALMEPAAYPHQAVATMAPTPEPMETYTPTRDEVANQVARQRVARNPQHFRCLSLSGNMLTPRNAIPDANVTATIAFDKRTGSHEVVTVNSSEVTISYEKTYKPNRATGGTFVYDNYRWTYARGIQPYMVFTKNIDKDGNVYWSARPQWPHGGAYDIELRRGSDVSVVYIVATDTTASLDTCEQGNDLADEVWDAVVRLH